MLIIVLGLFWIEVINWKIFFLVILGNVVWCFSLVIIGLLLLIVKFVFLVCLIGIFKKKLLKLDFIIYFFVKLIVLCKF